MQATSLPVRASRLHNVSPATKLVFTTRCRVFRFVATASGFDARATAGLTICTPPAGVLAVSKVSDFAP